MHNPFSEFIAAWSKDRGHSVNIGTTSDPFTLSLEGQPSSIVLSVTTRAPFKLGATHAGNNQPSAFLLCLVTEALTDHRAPAMGLPRDGEMTLTDDNGNELIFRSDGDLISIDGTTTIVPALNDPTSLRFASLIKEAVFR